MASSVKTLYDLLLQFGQSLFLLVLKYLIEKNACEEKCKEHFQYVLFISSPPRFFMFMTLLLLPKHTTSQKSDSGVMGIPTKMCMSG